MAAHARLGMSSLDRILACPASVRMTEGLQEEESPWAKEGTLAHEQVEQHLLMETDSEDGAVQVMLDYVRSRFLECPDMELHTEVRVEPTQLGRKDCWGTSDVVLIDWYKKILEVVDYKHGKGVLVEVEDNKQLLGYLLGSIAKYQTTAEWHYSVTIVQPRIEHPDGVVRTKQVEYNDLMQKAVEWSDRLAMVDDEVPVFGPSLKACRWCKAKAICERRAGHSLEALGLSFDPIDTDKLDEPYNLSLDKLRQILDSASEIRAWLSDVETRATADLINHKEVPGYKLVRGRSNRAWAKSEDEIKAELKSCGLKVSEIMTSKLSTPAAIEKVAKARKLKKDKVERIAGLITKPEGKLTLAHVTDSRPDATPARSVEGKFKDIESEDTFNEMLN
jgi:hypothetical protein